MTYNIEPYFLSLKQFGPFGQIDRLKPISKAKTPEVSFADIAGLDEVSEK